MNQPERETSPQTPLVSIIAISYNHAKFVSDTLQSIADQSFNNFELVYCDDASTDGTTEVATQWLSRLKVPWQTILHSTNSGLCRTLNEALRICRGTFIQYISCDDRLHPQKLERQLSIFSRSPESVAVVCSEANLINEVSQPQKPFLFTRRYAVPDASSRTALFQQLLRGDPCIAAPTALIRKAALDEVGGYDEQLPTEDYDMWLRLLRKFDFVVLDDVTADFRVHPQNFHAELDRSGKWRKVRYQILRKHLDDPYAREIFRKDLAHAICDNQLGPVSINDLIACQFDLQEVADAVQRMKNSKTYWACTRLRDIYVSLRRLIHRNGR
ncbi:glycosyltransferase [Planctomicrobium sp. SH661]|uniref:glycosyltransferase n=1 Tax=Planctomicrobium sp. SH661 TaxID=3448124 RepID=UPI003F5BED80